MLAHRLSECRTMKLVQIQLATIPGDRLTAYPGGTCYLTGPDHWDRRPVSPRLA
jgi:hypothetical protein